MNLRNVALLVIILEFSFQSETGFLSSKNDNFKNGAQKINNDNNTSYFMTTLFIICNYI